MTHGFDDTGHLLDKNGDEKDWWDRESVCVREIETHVCVITHKHTHIHTHTHTHIRTHIHIHTHIHTHTHTHTRAHTHAHTHTHTHIYTDSTT